MAVVENAYINHRKYLNSFSPEQLQGKPIDATTAQKECTPFPLNKDMGVNASYGGAALDPAAVSSPCGFKGISCFLTTFSQINE